MQTLTSTPNPGTKTKPQNHGNSNSMLLMPQQDSGAPLSWTYLLRDRDPNETLNLVRRRSWVVQLLHEQHRRPSQSRHGMAAQLLWSLSLSRMKMLLRFCVYCRRHLDPRRRRTFSTNGASASAPVSSSVLATRTVHYVSEARVARATHSLLLQDA